MRNSKYLSVTDLELSGIYFLFNGGELMYIGKTVSFHARINSHARSKKIPFNRVRFIPCWPVKLNYYERRWIKRFKPPFNAHFNGMQVKSHQVNEVTAFMRAFSVRL